MTGITCALAGASGSIYAGSATVTVGQRVDASYTIWGYADALAGSVVPTTWANTGGFISQLCWFDAMVDFVSFRINAVFPNDGWTTMTIGGVPFTRASASYSNDGTDTNWTWITTNPFGTTIGATRAIIWS